MIYFDNAATTWPKPREVTKAVRLALTKPFGNPGRGSHKAAADAAETVFRLRESAACLFGAKPENVILTTSATHGLNFAVKAAATPGCRILVSDIEHNSVRRPVLAVSRELGCEVVTFSSSGGDAAILADAAGKIKPGRTLVVTAHHSNITNLTVPVAMIGKLCRSAGCTLVVDAAQSAGHADINVERDAIDFLCMPGHKGLYGPMGTGLMILSLRAAERAARYSTVFEGGSGVNSLDADMPDVLPERFEAGTLNAHGAAGLLAGIGWVRKMGVASIASREEALYSAATRLLEKTEGVTVYGNGAPGPIVLFNIKGRSPSSVAAALDDRGICVRSGYHCAPAAHRSLGTEDGAVRISFGAFNTLSEVRGAASAICEIAEEK